MFVSKIYENIIDFWVSDDATSDKSNTYGTPITIMGTPNFQMSYDNNNKYYILNHNSNNANVLVPIDCITDVTNIQLEADIYLNATSSGFNVGFGLYEPSDSSNIQFLTIPNNNMALDIFENSDHLVQNTPTFRKIWGKLTVIIHDKNCTISLKNISTGATIASTTYTMSLNTTTNTKIGIICYKGNNSVNGFIKNIQIKAL